MNPILDSIRKIARYTPQAWGGSMKDVGNAPGKAYDMPLSFTAGPLATKGISKAIGRSVTGAASFGVWDAANLGIEAVHGGRKVRHAASYGSRLGKSNPYLASSI